MFESAMKKEFSPESIEDLRDNFRLVANIASKKLKINPHKNSLEFRKIIYDSIEEYDKDGKLRPYEKENYCKEVGKLLRIWSEAALHEKKLNCEEKNYE